MYTRQSTLAKLFCFATKLLFYVETQPEPEPEVILGK
jgi:hypothetical protein